jgi:IclR family transcriptional regulator, acetate operon repressor
MNVSDLPATLTAAAETATTDNDSPTLRAFAVVEAVGRSGRPMLLMDVVAAVGLPKATVHRILTQLVDGGLLRRLPGAGYGVGTRLSRLGRDLITNDAGRPARRAILQRLVDSLGETCNFTMLDGAEIIYLDRVETASPLRVNLQPGSRIPAHCSASGKLLLAHLPPVQYARLASQLPLTRFTARTIVDRAALSAELERIRQCGYSVDDEEYLEGLVCVAVPVTDEQQRVWATVAVHGPAARMPIDAALARLPELQAAAAALGETYRSSTGP